MSILGLDQSTHTGWAVGHPGGLPKWGVHHCRAKDSDHGEAYARYRAWLIDMFTEHGVTRVVFESPIQAGSPVTQRFQWGLHTVIEEVCSTFKLPCNEIHNATWFKYWVGSGRPSKIELKLGKYATESAWKKDMSLRQAANRGWLTDDHNIADALGIWDHACFLIDPSYRFRRGPEIRRRETKQERLFG